MEVKPRLPIDPETQAPNEDVEFVGGQAYVIKVFADCPVIPRPLWRITIRRGPVAPGRLAAVHTRDGSLQLGKIYYERTEEGLELVCIMRCLPGASLLCYPLADVAIEGRVVSVCEEGEQL